MHMHAYTTYVHMYTCYISTTIRYVRRYVCQYTMHAVIANPGSDGIVKRQDNDDDTCSSCPNLKVMRGRDGRDGITGAPGATGKDGRNGDKGMTGDMGPMGPPGPRGPPGGGNVYIRWGRTTCPNTTGTELVYQGIAAGSWYSHTGGGANYLCLPQEPKYSNYRPGVQGHSPLYGTEYETQTNFPLSHVHTIGSIKTKTDS